MEFLCCSLPPLPLLGKLCPKNGSGTSGQGEDGELSNDPQRILIVDLRNRCHGQNSVLEDRTPPAPPRRYPQCPQRGPSLGGREKAPGKCPLQMPPPGHALHPCFAFTLRETPPAPPPPAFAPGLRISPSPRKRGRKGSPAPRALRRRPGVGGAGPVGRCGPAPPGVRPRPQPRGARPGGQTGPRPHAQWPGRRAGAGCPPELQQPSLPMLPSGGLPGRRVGSRDGGGEEAATRGEAAGRARGGAGGRALRGAPPAPAAPRLARAAGAAPRVLRGNGRRGPGAAAARRSAPGRRPPALDGERPRRQPAAPGRPRAPPRGRGSPSSACRGCPRPLEQRGRWEPVRAPCVPLVEVRPPGPAGGPVRRRRSRPAPLPPGSLAPCSADGCERSRTRCCVFPSLEYLLPGCLLGPPHGAARNAGMVVESLSFRTGGRKTPGRNRRGSGKPLITSPLCCWIVVMSLDFLKYGNE